MSVPYADLKAQYLSIKPEIDQAIAECIDTTSFIGGKKVGAFEDDFAQYAEVDHCVACANGTDALEIALKALDIGPGDEVIVPAITWISTAGAVNNVGAEPVFVDILEDERTIDPGQIEEKITSKTKAIIPVHLYGLPARMPEIMEIANTYGLKVIEDSAQAHGASIENKKVGSFGHITTFSFYPGKNLGAYGDAGGIVTNDDELARTCKLITNHGQVTKHDYRIIGRNSRLDTIQAAILKTKLPHMQDWTEKRILNANHYLNKLTSVKLPIVPEGYKHVFHVFAIQSDRRDELKSTLDQKGIGNSIHYPAPLPHIPSFGYKKHQLGEFPIAEKISSEVLSIPMFAEMTDIQINEVVEAINSL